MPRLSLEGLEVLDAIDRKGSFAAAAAALYRVPSKVTYTVNKLEEDLGVTLFRREGRRSVLTPAGRLLLEQGREILAAAERLVESTRELDRGWESGLAIALDSVLTLDALAPHLERLYALRADIELTLTEEVLGGSWEAIREGRADLVVGAPAIELALPGIRLEPLMEVEWIFAVAAGHPLTALERPLTAADLPAYRGVVVRDSSRHLPALSRRVFERQPLLRVASMQQKIEAQRRGLGTGYLPRHRVQALLERGELVALDLDGDPAPATPLHMAWKSGNQGKALGVLLDSLRAGFRAGP